LSTGHTSLRYRSLWAQLGPLGRIALGAALLGTLILLLSGRAVLTATLTPAADTSSAAATDQQQREERFKKGFEDHLAQINGRSLFFIPAAPRRPDAPPGPDPEPSAPTSYGGPALLGFANGAAFFADGRRLAAGDKGDGTLRIKAINPPWDVVVEWEGVEFTVSLFDHDRVVFPNANAAGSEHAAPVPAVEAAVSGAEPARAADAEPDSGTDVAKPPAPSPESPPAPAPPAPEPAAAPR